jgi:hypothetical protein
MRIPAMNTMRRHFDFLELAAIGAVVAASGIALTDRQNRFRWVSLGLWMAAIALTVVPSFRGTLKTRLSNETAALGGALAVITLAAHFWYLSIYPFGTAGTRCARGVSSPAPWRAATSPRFTGSTFRMTPSAASRPQPSEATRLRRFASDRPSISAG